MEEAECLQAAMTGRWASRVADERRVLLLAPSQTERKWPVLDNT